MTGPLISLKLDLSDRERRALRYCTYCPRMCRFACPVAHGEARETVTPWGLMRLLNLVDQGHVAADRGILEVLEHCISCGRCTTYCLHHNPVAEVLESARAQMVEAGLEVPDAWQVPEGGCEGREPLPAWNADRPDLPAFSPSCAHGGSPEAASRLRDGLAALDGAGLPVWVEGRDRIVGCGYHEWEVGDRAAASRSWARFVEPGRGRPVCITDCAPGLWALGGDASPVVHLAEWLADHVEDLPQGRFEGRVAVHDSCFVTRRLGLGGAVRSVVRRLTGREPLDLHEAGDEARCCGSSGRWAEVHPEAHARATASVVSDIADTGADLVVTGSPTCRMNIQQQVDEVALTGPSGEPVAVVDLLGLLAR